MSQVVPIETISDPQESLIVLLTHSTVSKQDTHLLYVSQNKIKHPNT